MKFAVTAVSAFSVKPQLGAVPLQAPPQPVNLALKLAQALSEIGVPIGKW